jgi:predicted histidine transporter YuiF (NhaC family)
MGYFWAMQTLLLDALYAVGLGQLLEAVVKLLFAAGILGFLLYLWIEYRKERKRSQLASGIQWTVADTQASLERKKGRRRVWVAIVIVCALLASYPW